MNKRNRRIDGRSFVEKAAAHRGWQLCDDQELLADIVAGLEANFQRYGYFQCPCRDSWGTKEKDRDIICPCDYAAPDIETYGHCYCGLFFQPSDKPNIPCQIPAQGFGDLGTTRVMDTDECDTRFVYHLDLPLLLHKV